MVATPDRSQGLLVTHRAELVRNPVLNHPYAIRVHTSVGDERGPAYPGDSDDQLRILESGVQLSTIAHACHRVAHAAWEDEREDIVDSCHHWESSRSWRHLHGDMQDVHTGRQLSGGQHRTPRVSVGLRGDAVPTYIAAFPRSSCGRPSARRSSLTPS